MQRSLPVCQRTSSRFAAKRRKKVAICFLERRVRDKKHLSPRKRAKCAAVARIECAAAGCKLLKKGHPAFFDSEKRSPAVYAEERSFLPPLYQPAAAKAEADRNGCIYFFHDRAVHLTHTLPQPPLIQGADLFEQNHRILGQAAA